MGEKMAVATCYPSARCDSSRHSGGGRYPGAGMTRAVQWNGRIHSFGHRVGSVVHFIVVKYNNRVPKATHGYRIVFYRRAFWAASPLLECTNNSARFRIGKRGHGFLGRQGCRICVVPDSIRELSTSVIPDLIREPAAFVVPDLIRDPAVSVVPDLIRDPETVWVPAFAGTTEITMESVVYGCRVNT